MDELKKACFASLIARFSEVAPVHNLGVRLLKFKVQLQYTKFGSIIMCEKVAMAMRPLKSHRTRYLLLRVGLPPDGS